LKKLILFLFLITLIGCSQQPPPYAYGTLDLEKDYNTLEGIVKDSSLIAEASLQNKSEIIPFKGSDFNKTQLKVEKVYKGDPKLENTNIDVLELSMLNITKDVGTGKFLLFLKPYEGPIVQNSYVITGVYQGRFKVSDTGQLIYDADKYGGLNKFQREFVKTPISSLSNILK